MILIDALYINNGGGKVLLELLIEKLKNKNIHFLIDIRLKKTIILNNENVTFLNPNIFIRHLFYIKYRNKFKFVFCFANIPPTLKLNCFVVTYFHNLLLIKNSRKFNLILFLKVNFIRFFEHNTDRWFVQSNIVKQELNENNFNINKIEVYPFFEDFSYIIQSKNTTIENLVFLYVSSGETHKNHILLFEAFAKYSILYPQSTLKVTISDKFSSLLALLKEKKYNGIINLGFIEKEKLNIEYNITDVIIFPSLRESFGLGLIEAAQFKLPIIASDLKYVYEVVKPTCVFNPHDIDSLFSVLINHKLYFNKHSSLNISNKLNQIVSLILSYS